EAVRCPAGEQQDRGVARIAVRRRAAAPDCARDLQEPLVRDLRIDGQPADPRHRRPRARDARGCRAERGRSHGGAVDRELVPGVLGQERPADRGRSEGGTREAVSSYTTEGALRGGYGREPTISASRPRRATHQITTPKAAAAATIVPPNNSSVEYRIDCGSICTCRSSGTPLRRSRSGCSHARMLPR